MKYLNEQTLTPLKAARQKKGLSQKELSIRSGVPQSHISKIENGGVDLRVSSLIALARVLELELELVPRKAIPAIQSIVRSIEISDYKYSVRKNLHSKNANAIHEPEPIVSSAYELTDEAND